MRRLSSLVVAAASLLLVLEATSTLASDHRNGGDQRTLEQSSSDGPETRADRQPLEQPSGLQQDDCSGYGPKRKECLQAYLEAQREQPSLQQDSQVPHGEQETTCPRSVLQFEEDARAKLHRIWADPTKSATSCDLAKKNEITKCIVKLSKPINCSSDTACKRIAELVFSAIRYTSPNSLIDWIQETGLYNESACGGAYLKGFEFDSEMWQDIDECRENKGGCAHECENTIGSFRCKCRVGYYLQEDDKSCVDIDECRLNVFDCAQECENTVGSYKCRCGPGYSLSSDGKSCDDVDECRQNETLCTDICENTIGSYECKCQEGLFLMEDKRSCDNADECAYDENGRREAHCTHICYNMPFGFACSCPKGFAINKLKPHSCIDVRNGEYPPHAHKCSLQ